MTRRELRSFASSFRKGVVNDHSDMMCYAVCAPLQGLLSMCGVNTKLVEVDFGTCNHFWLELENGDILDPTADQFSGPLLKLPKVYIGPVPDIYRRWMDEADAPARKDGGR